MRVVTIDTKQWRPPAAIILSALALAPVWVQAAALVTIRVEAKHTPVEQILATLNHEFHLQYKSSATLDREITGTYQGSLEQVLTKVLEGYDFILKNGDSGLEVRVLGIAARANAGAVMAGATPTSQVMGPASLAASRHTAPPPGPPGSTPMIPPAPTHGSPVVASLTSLQPSGAVAQQAMEVGPADPAHVPVPSVSSLAPPVPTGPGQTPEVIPSTDAPVASPTSAAGPVPESISATADASLTSPGSARGTGPKLTSSVSNTPAPSPTSLNTPTPASVSSPFDDFDLLQRGSTASGLQEQQVLATIRRP